MHIRGKQRTQLFAKHHQVYETNILNLKAAVLLSPKFRAHKWYKFCLLSTATAISERSLIFQTWVHLSQSMKMLSIQHWLEQVHQISGNWPAHQPANAFLHISRAAF